jgi:ribose/xylose/arabinose/galactoside ABC-type transport system permease subunit
MTGASAALVADTLLESERQEQAARAARAARSGALMERFGVMLPFVLVAALGIVLVPNFLSASNVANVLVNASLTAVIGFGMTIVIALRGLDLSVGSTMALTACVSAMTVNAAGPWLGAAAGLVVGAVVGLLNGLLVAYVRVPAFVATLGTLGIIRGAALLITGGSSIMVTDRSFSSIATSRAAGIPVPLILALVLLLLWHTVLERTPFGRHVCAVGGRPEAAVDSGIRVKSVTLKSFIIVGVSAAVAGVLTASQLGSVDGTLGTGLELQIIAITVLGGTSLAGGSGNLVGTFIAAVLLAMISSGLNLLNIPPFYQYLAVGLLLLLALSLDSIRRRVQRRALLGA